jgi:hypothetical protein
MIPRGHMVQAFAQHCEERLGPTLVATTLHQAIEGVTVLIHGPLWVMASAVDGQDQPVERPIVSGPEPMASPLMGAGFAGCAPRLAEHFVAHHDLTCEEQRFDIAAAQANAEMEPDGMPDDLG